MALHVAHSVAHATRQLSDLGLNGYLKGFAPWFARLNGREQSCTGHDGISWFANHGFSTAPDGLIYPTQQPTHVALLLFTSGGTRVAAPDAATNTRKPVPTNVKESNAQATNPRRQGQP